MAYICKKNGPYDRLVARFFQKNTYGSLEEIEDWIMDYPVYIEGESLPNVKRTRRRVPSRNFIRKSAMRYGCSTVRLRNMGAYKGMKYKQGITIIFRPGISANDIYKVVDKNQIEKSHINCSCKDRVTFSLVKK